MQCSHPTAVNSESRSVRAHCRCDINSNFSNDFHFLLKGLGSIGQLHTLQQPGGLSGQPLRVPAGRSR